MRCRVAVEDIEPGHYVAWALDLPGCFSSAPTEEEAVTCAPDRVADYFSWLGRHDPSLPVSRGPFEVEVVEVFCASPSQEDPDYLVNAFFEDDRRPLGYWEVEAALRLLGWSRQDLLAAVQPLSHERLHRPIPGQVHVSIAGVLEHVAGAENWYLGQLDLALDRSALAGGPLTRLGAIRAHARTQLVGLIGQDRIAQSLGERWSARKVLRRMLWHERDHTQHIGQLVFGKE